MMQHVPLMSSISEAVQSMRVLAVRVKAQGFTLVQQ